MGRSRFVRPESRKLDLSDGDWLLVKKRLTTGEQRDAFMRAYVERADGTFVVHPGKIGVQMVVAYLLDWSFADDSGQQVVIRAQDADIVEAALRGLDPDDFAETRAAIEAHEAKMIAEREAQKKTRAGVMPSSAISDSPSAAAGVSTTSAPSMAMSA